jgi:microcystin-dependent protein
MPRNSSGVYSVPAGTFAVTDTDISSTAYNGFLSDISAEMTNSFNVQGTAPMLAAFNGGGFKVTNLAPGTAPTDAATLLQAQSAVPSGAVFWFAAATAPTGFLECNGASLSTTTNATLFAAIGFTFGGSGASFTLPDLRGRFIRGWDHGRGIDVNTPSRTFASGQNFANAAHTHTVSDPGHNHTISQSPHAHGISDPGHAHGVSDPGHVHGLSSGVGQVTIPIGVSSLAASANGGATVAAVTGISIEAAGTGVGVQAINANVVNVAAVTGITNVAQGAPEVTVTNVALLPCIKT